MEPEPQDNPEDPRWERRQSAQPSMVRRPVVIACGVVLIALVAVGIGSIFRERPAREAKAAPAPQTDAVNISRDILNWTGPKTAVPGHERPEPPPPPPKQEPPPEVPKRASGGAAKPSEFDEAKKAARTAEILVENTSPKEQEAGQQGRPQPLTMPATLQQDAAGGMLSPQQRFLAKASGRQETAVQGILEEPLSPWVVQAGTTIPAALITGINSDLPGFLKATVSSPVYDSITHKTVLIPQGSVLVGQYDDQIVYGQSRVLVVWTRLLLPNGKSIQLEGMPGIDLSGLSGLKGRVNNHWWALTRAVLLSSVLSVGVRVPFGSPSGGNYHQNLAQEFSQDFSAGLNQAGQRIVQRELNRKPTIDDINPGKALLVFVHKDFVLEPWQTPVAQRSR